MSAETLRRAADKLEALAQDATPGPWRQHRDEAEMLWHGDQARTYAMDARPGDFTDADWAEWEKTTGQLGHGDLRRSEDAAYIAAIHPGVGKALAAWLRWAADQQGTSRWVAIVGPAGDVARQILGEEA